MMCVYSSGWFESAEPRLCLLSLWQARALSMRQPRLTSETAGSGSVLARHSEKRLRPYCCSSAQRAMQWSCNDLHL